MSQQYRGQINESSVDKQLTVADKFLPLNNLFYRIIIHMLIKVLIFIIFVLLVTLAIIFSLPSLHPPEKSLLIVSGRVETNPVIMLTERKR